MKTTDRPLRNAPLATILRTCAVSRYCYTVRSVERLTRALSPAGSAKSPEIRALFAGMLEADRRVLPDARRELIASFVTAKRPSPADRARVAAEYAIARQAVGS